MTDEQNLPANAGDQASGLILTLRSTPVLIDADLATLYGVTTKALNQAVQRNTERFPQGFKFQLSREEKMNWSQSVTGSISSNIPAPCPMRSQSRAWQCCLQFCEVPQPSKPAFRS
jgi:hypothetical protein